ncbi:MAG: NADP-dependent oxidoreductase [Bryobacterales bacterium]|nr:NADP-dependent oxidoreductase [Bryobacterales bacterium]
MSELHRRYVLATRPTGLPTPENFRLESGPVPEPGEGEVVLRTLYLSVDPYMRGRLRDVPSYAPPVQIGELMTGGGVGRVIASRHPQFAVGEVLEGLTGWQTHVVSDGKMLRRVDESLAPVSTALGVLGMTGLTAYFGLLDICHPREGETVLVSGAAGAVGSLVGQIAKIHGCRAVGIAGADDKVRWITGELGFDAAFNYKTVAEKDYRRTIAALCPNGVDVYFDNVGGPITDAVFPNLNLRGRVSICGQISQYNDETAVQGPRHLFHLIVKRAKVEGFLVMDYAERFKEGRAKLAGWLKDGRLKHREQIVDGFENTPQAFIGMLQGENTGKMLVRVAAE